MADFLAMGGYGAFIWPCYAVTLGGMIWTGLGSWLRARRAARVLKQIQHNETDG